MYGSECWTTNRKMEQIMRATEMGMLRWTSGLAREDGIRNEFIRCSIGVTPITGKTREDSLIRLGRLFRRNEAQATGVVIRTTYMERKKGSRRPKKRLFEVKESELKMAEVCDRVQKIEQNGRWELECPS